MLLQPHEQIGRPRRAAAGDHRLQRLDPFGGLFRVGVFAQCEQAFRQKMVELAYPIFRFHPAIISQGAARAKLPVGALSPKAQAKDRQRLTLACGVGLMFRTLHFEAGIVTNGGYGPFYGVRGRGQTPSPR